MFIRLFPLIIFISFAESCVSQAADRGRPANQSTEAKQLTTKQELAINSIAKKHRNGNVNLQMIKKEIQSQTILSSVSVQSALGQVMTKIQEDAEKDVEYASINAHSATDRKDSLKRRVEELKTNREDLQKKLREEYDTLKAASVSSNHGNSNLTKIVNQEKLSEINEQNAIRQKKTAEDHLQSIKEAIKRSQQTQFQ